LRGASGALQPVVFDTVLAGQLRKLLSQVLESLRCIFREIEFDGLEFGASPPPI